MDLVIPLHPRTLARIAEFGLGGLLARPRVRILEPIGYREMLSLTEAARFVITDSGGIQEETTFLGVPCLTVRENTERPITVTHGTNTLVGRDFPLAWRTIDDIERGCYKKAKSIDGWDGHAAPRICRALVNAWS